MPASAIINVDVSRFVPLNTGYCTLGNPPLTLVPGGSARVTLPSPSTVSVKRGGLIDLTFAIQPQNYYSVAGLIFGNDGLTDTRNGNATFAIKALVDNELTLSNKYTKAGAGAAWKLSIAIRDTIPGSPTYGQIGLIDPVIENSDQVFTPRRRRQPARKPAPKSRRK